MKIIFKGIIQKGKVKLDAPERYLVHLSGLEGKRIELTLEKERKQRSSQQNKFYWSVVVNILAEHFGYSVDELHESLKWKFLKQHEDSLVTVRSTTTLNTAEFVDYIDRIMMWAAQEHGIYIPNANEVVIE